jgi:hypothetical protein
MTKQIGQLVGIGTGLALILGGWIYMDDRIHAVAKEKADVVAKDLAEGKEQYVQALGRFQYHTQEGGLLNELRNARSEERYYNSLSRMHPEDQHLRRAERQAQEDVRRLERELSKYRRGNTWSR